MDFWELTALGAAIMVVAGTVKGLTGLGLPTAAISLMTLVIDPRTAIALILGPMLVTNAWQVWRMGEIWRATKNYALFGVCLAAFVLITLALAASAPDRLIFGVLGASVVVFCVINLSFTVPALPRRYDRAAQATFGSAAGVLGGLTGVWAAPLAVYLSTRQVEKDEFVRATGLLIFIGSAPLCIGMILQGAVTPTLGLGSLILILPTLLGFTIGERLRRDLSSERFRRIFLYIFLVMGLNLLRRALF